MSAQDVFDTIVTGKWPLIEHWIAAEQPESLHLDFKRRDPRARPGELETSDLGVLGKAMSGFANTDGGVLLFGLDINKGGKGDPNRLSPDASVQARANLADAPAFKRALQRHFKDVTIPTVPGVTMQEVVNPVAPPTGIVALLVHGSDGKPHRTAGHLQSDVSHRYYMRTDTDTLPMPHEMLAALFGRVPPPKLSLVVKWERQAGASTPLIFYLRNRGRGAAREPIVRIIADPAKQLVESHTARSVNRTPAGNYIVLEPHTFRTIYPGFDQYLGGLEVRRPYEGTEASVRIRGTIYGIEMQPVEFDQIVDFAVAAEAELPRPPT